MNVNKLWAEIKKNGDTQGELAKMMGVTRATLSNKMSEKNKASFTQPEISFIKERYNLSPEEVDAIFFDEKVS